MNTQKLWYLEGIDLFGRLCPIKSESNASVSDPQQFKASDIIYFQDSEAKYLHVIVQGRVKIGTYLNDGKEVTKAILGEGEVFGEMALAGEDQRQEYAEAMDNDTLVCMLSLDEIKELMLKENGLSIRIMKWMGLRLRKLERKIELLTFRDARTRIIEFLKDAAAWKGKPIGHEVLIRTKLTHSNIAQLTATSRQTVSEVLNQLKTEDQIYMERGKILIRDLENLN
ncbi:MAG: CRP/FNR family cyclic AMP-dependent transcriptional regulator [Cryomorphaceae bacterium]|jgi:CRP/FNR family cyclic AMP-dependent transcriptional regulator